jgi:serine/threonine-protein kinase
LAKITPPTQHRVLADRYELISRIGSGGMAEVWRARDRRLGRDVAVKLLAGPAARDPSRRRRIEREARTLASVSDPSIVAVYDYGEEQTEDDVRPYLVMELVDGPDLHRYLQEHGRLDPERTSEILMAVTAAVARAHDAGIIHGDLKPANIFVDKSGPKVGDFGVARMLDEETGSTTLAATPAFAAPEVLRGAKPTAASDVYSLACLAFELLAGHPPYEGANAWEVASKHLEAPIPSVRVARPDVPVELDEAIREGMQKDPRGRPRTAAAFGERLIETPLTMPIASVGAATVPQADGRPQTEVLPSRPDLKHVAVFGPFAGVAAAARRRMERRRERTARNRSRGMLLAISLLVAVPFLILLLAMRGNDMRVPDVRGQTESAAVAALKKAGLAVSGVSYEPVEQGQAGIVVRTIPPRGQTVSPGAQVHVIASAFRATPTPAPAVDVQRFLDRREADRGRGNDGGRGNSKNDDD